MNTEQHNHTGWRKEAPTVAGYYWWRDDPEYNTVIVWVSTDGAVLQIGSTETQPAVAMGGEWCGPLRPADDREAEDWPP